MKFRNFIEITAHHMPHKIMALLNRPLDLLDKDELRLLGKWYGVPSHICNSEDCSNIRNQIQRRKMAKPEPPDVETVLDRVRQQLAHQGRKGGKWLPRRLF